MEYIYAAMLLHKSGKKIEETAVTKVLEAAGLSVDSAKVKALVAALDGVDIDKAIKESVQAAPVAAAASPAGPAGGEAEKKPEEDQKKAAEEDKKQEEQAAAGLGALFG